MSLLLPSQLDAIRVTSFDFNAGFLDRMATMFDDYLAAGGMLAAGESPGPLTEIAENHALLGEIIAGAERWTNPQDSSRMAGVVRLAEFFPKLDDLCRRLSGMSVRRLRELRSQPDLYDAAFLNRVAAASEEYLAATLGLLKSGQRLSESEMRNAFDTAADAIQAALESPAHDDPDKAAAIERLSAIRDGLRELF